MTATERGMRVGEGPQDGEGDDEDRARDGDGADDQQEVAAADVTPPLLVEPEGGEDDDLADDDEADRLREEHVVAVRHAPRIEEAQPERQVEGQGDERRRRQVPGVPGCDRRGDSTGAWDPASLEPERSRITALPMLHLIIYADITGPIVDFCVNVINDTGLAGVFLLMAAGSACIPIPSEAVMLFAGFNVSNGDQTLLGITLAGLAGNMAGSWLTYAIGYYGRIDLLEKNRLIHLSPSRLEWVDGWFKRHGDATVFFARLLPLVRAFISLPAGVAKMPFWRFTWLTALGSLPWVLGFGLLGRAVGDNWEQWRHHLQVFDYLTVAAVIGLIAYALVRRRRAGAGPTRAGRPSRSASRELERGDRGEDPRRARAWRLDSSRARPSCSRYRAPPTSSSSPGSPAGTGRSSTRSCARASRWRCMPARRSPC